ncbi:MAG: ThuA domain-containing protein [Bacteroidales bacterium]|nr:ThuA domain-containing protein [Bacteroidales bacterium]
MNSRYLKNLLPLIKLFVLVLFIMICSSHSSEKQDSPEIRVLVITGGHAFEHEAFFEMFDSLSGITYTEVTQPDANQLYSSPMMNKYDALVFYDMVQEITDEQKEAFINLLEEGKGMIFLHHSLASYQEWNEFRRIIGGRYYLQPYFNGSKQYTASTYKHGVEIPVKIPDKNHPVTAGLKEFIIHDEVYGNFEVLPEVHPILSTTHPESGEIIGWTNSYKNSKIVYIQLGHDHHAYSNPKYRRLLKQAISWVLNK